MLSLHPFELDFEPAMESYDLRDLSAGTSVANSLEEKLGDWVVEFDGDDDDEEEVPVIEVTMADILFANL
jgi:hypothetical protein